MRDLLVLTVHAGLKMRDLGLVADTSTTDGPGLPELNPSCMIRREDVDEYAAALLPLSIRGLSVSAVSTWRMQSAIEQTAWRDSADGGTPCTIL